MIPVPLVHGFYRSDSLPLSAQRCVNWIPISPEVPTLSDKSLFDARGLLQVGTLGNSPNRGCDKMDGVPYFVNGNSLYALNSDYSATDLGYIEGAGRVSMANDGEYLVIVVPGAASYTYTSGTLAKITDQNFRTADTVVYKDGYFVFTASDGSVFFNSLLTRPVAFDALDIGSAEINPDKIVAAHVNHNELFICGEETIELFQNVGGADFPFARIPGANIQKGVHARHSLVEFDNTFLFLGGGKNEKTAVWKVASSANAQKVSTSAIDAEIQKFTRNEIANAFALNFAIGGNYFAAFTFESERIPSKTFVYDVTTSVLTNQPFWHERQSGVLEDRWRVQCIVDAYGELLVGDAEDGRIGRFDQDTYTEYGNPVYREIATMPFSDNNLPLFASELQLTMETGVGLNTTGNGANPQIRMDFSDNGARTFKPEQWRSYGRQGEFQILPTWRRQGRIPRHRVLRFKTTAPVKSNILRLSARVQGGIE